MDDAKGRNRPSPDPTELTTQALYREIASLKELFSIQMKMEHDLKEQKFNYVYLQFSTIERLRIEQKNDTATAVSAALQAAKESVVEQNKSSASAIAKSEAGITKQIDAQGVLITTSTNNLEGKINDIKGRLDRIEGGALIKKDFKSDNMSWYALLVSIGAVLLSVFLK